MVILGAQALFSLGMLVSVGSALGLIVGAIAILLGAAALFACTPVIQTRLATAAGPAATVAFALNGSMIFAGQGVGTAIGGATTAYVGLAWIGLAGAGVAAIGLALASRDLTVRAMVDD